MTSHTSHPEDHSDIHDRKNLSDRVAERIIDWIRTNKITTGDMIPPERELMKMFQVSRLACREGIAKLQGMGVLNAHHGKGVYLADIGAVSVNPAVLKLLQVYGNISSSDVIEARLLIEPPVAGFAAKRATRTERMRIWTESQTAADDLSTLYLPERAQRFGEMDVRLHQMIAAASRNRVIGLMFKHLHELLLRVRFEVLILKLDIMYRALRDHQRIAKAILDGKATEAAKAMESHIRDRGSELLGDKSQM